jgi:hypothetical protein
MRPQSKIFCNRFISRGVALLPLLPLLGALLLGCAGDRPKFRDEIGYADRQREWGLVYYQSWQKERNRDYLVLARQRTQEAVSLYLDVQRRMGYAYPDFYVVDKRRQQSCIFLSQMQAEAESYAVRLRETQRLGCYD